jgi:hypothetical protein
VIYDLPLVQCPALVHLGYRLAFGLWLGLALNRRLSLMPVVTLPWCIGWLFDYSRSPGARWLAPNCSCRAWMVLKKPMKTIAKYYTKWYDFAYILNQEGLKNQGVKNMCGVIDG